MLSRAILLSRNKPQAIVSHNIARGKIRLDQVMVSDEDKRVVAYLEKMHRKKPYEDSYCRFTQSTHFECSRFPKAFT